MIIRYTDGALGDLKKIQAHQAVHWPSKGEAFEGKLSAIEARLVRFSSATPEVSQRPGVRVVAFVDFPFRLFYRVNDQTIESLAIRHTSRRPLFD